jgi:hypothetical protein
MCTDAEDDIKWKLALCTAITIYEHRPIQITIFLKHSQAASLILKVMAKSWSTVVIADTIYMSDIVGLLNRFPTFAVPFLTDHIKLVQTGERFYLSSRDLNAARCASQWVRAAVSFETCQESCEWERVTQEYLARRAKLRMMSQLFPETACDRYIQKRLQRALANFKGNCTSIMIQHAIPVRDCNTIELLRAAVAIAESQGSALVFKSEVLAAITDLHWDLYGQDDHYNSFWLYVILLISFTVLIVLFDTWASSTNSLQRSVGLAIQTYKCIFTLWFVWQEYHELKHEKWSWFFDVWYIMDATAYSLV